MLKQDNGMVKYVTLTFDIEDWFQVESFKNKFPIETWDSQILRVELGTEKILELLKRYDIKATFFILGWIAERVPNLVKKIYDDGHEIASHGYSHQLNYNMKTCELFDDLERSKNILETITNEKVLGYRAPTFSVSDDVIEVLEKLQFEYDSSFNQFSKHDRYGKLSSKSNDAVFTLGSGFTEYSLPVTTVINQEVPIAGGGFFRLYPLWLTKKLLEKFYKKDNYYIFYAHPWEFDDNMPIVNGVGMMNKFRHYVNVKKNYKKMELLIIFLQSLDCTFLTIKEYEQLRKGGTTK